MESKAIFFRGSIIIQFDTQLTVYSVKGTKANDPTTKWFLQNRPRQDTQASSRSCHWSRVGRLGKNDIKTYFITLTKKDKNTIEIFSRNCFFFGGWVMISMRPVPFVPEPFENFRKQIWDNTKSVWNQFGRAKKIGMFNLGERFQPMRSWWLMFGTLRCPSPSKYVDFFRMPSRVCHQHDHQVRMCCLSRHH